MLSCGKPAEARAGCTSCRNAWVLLNCSACNALKAAHNPPLWVFAVPLLRLVTVRMCAAALPTYRTGTCGTGSTTPTTASRSRMS